jgi:hypothetical protein
MRMIGRAGPWGALPVRATIGATTWPTSVMRSRTPEIHFVPINKSVRNAENVTEGDTVVISFTDG